MENLLVSHQMMINMRNKEKAPVTSQEPSHKEVFLHLMNRYLK